MLLAGLMARELGGGRWAQLVAALAVAIAPISLLMGALFQYVAFDYLWWAVVAYCTIRLLRSENPRWWLGIGAAVGMGLLTKYTMAFCLAGLVVGVLLTSARRYLASRWLWGGAAPGVADRPAQPALAGAARLRLLGVPGGHPRARRGNRPDAGLSDGAALRQRELVHHPALGRGPVVLPRLPAGRRYRLLGWLYVVPFGLFLVAQGRSYSSWGRPIPCCWPPARSSASAGSAR